MRSKTYFGLATAFAGVGAAFSGYMTFVHFSRGTCAFNEPCPLFLGRPACYFGLLFFCLLLWISSYALARRSEALWPRVANFALSVAGAVFAGCMLVGEHGTHFALGLPSCTYGLFVFLALTVLSAYAWISWPMPPAGGSRLSSSHPAA